MSTQFLTSKFCVILFLYKPMEKAILVILIAILFHLSSNAQFSFRVFPIGVSGDAYADTLMNTRSVLLGAGIRQINASQTLAEVTRTFASKTVNLSREGRIEKLTTCFAKSKESNFTLCIYDTIVYGPSGDIVNMKKTDSKGNYYAPMAINYINEHEIVIVSNSEDSSASYQSYNEKGQLMAVRRTFKGQELENTRFYYNGDGLLDSTNNSYWGTFVFKRRKKGKDKLIEMENANWSYRWVYNQSGQCISHIVILKNRQNVVHNTSYTGDLKSEVSYFYNPDGTLSRVITKRSNMPAFTMHYSYIKY